MYIFIGKRCLFKLFSYENCCHLSAIWYGHLSMFINNLSQKSDFLAPSGNSHPQQTPPPPTKFLLPPPNVNPLPLPIK